METKNTLIVIEKLTQKMKRSLISLLSNLVNKNGSKEKIKVYEDTVIESIDEFVKEDIFYELPTTEILKIIEKCKIEDVSLLCEIISLMNKNKANESVLLLNVIDLIDSTYEECIRIISKFSNCPICKRIKEITKDNESLPDRDYQYEISELQSEISKLKNDSKPERIITPVIEYEKQFESDFFKACSNRNLEVIKYLYETFHVNVETKDNYGYTPINNASFSGHLDVVKYLYETCHADVETKNEFGHTPINNASVIGYLEVIKYLYETCHANIETKDKLCGHTPINNASTYGHLGVVKYLYEICHADVETKDACGYTPINNASKMNKLEVVKYLYETCHANIETKDNCGYTPINNASESGHLEVVKYLYETCHANLETKDNHGFSPIENAKKNNKTDIVNYLNGRIFHHGYFTSLYKL